MKKKYKKIIIGLILIILTVAYTYYVRPIVDDELYNYGFSFNITEGLIPYKDFNMIITPLFNYLLALILKIFGSKLIVYHVVIAIMLVTILYMSYEVIGKKAFVLYILLLLYPYIGYNLFTLCLLFSLFYFEEKNIKRLDIIEPIIISMMFLTKQTLGILIIPSIIFSKNKKKTIAIYLISVFTFLLYLIINGSVFQFFDYCLFGMFEFANKNSTGLNYLTIIEILIILALTYFSIKTKRKDIFFCLMFQIMALPIVNYIHFIISFVPVLYLLFKQFKDNKYLFTISISGLGSFFLAFNFLVCVGTEGNLKYLEHYKINNFMKGRITYTITDNYILGSKEIIAKYKNYTPYIFGRFAYIMKLNHGTRITKYDIINNGNMGYNGADKYIKEIDDYCQKNKCLFVINDQEDSISITIQTNMKILKYVQDNYRGIYNSNLFSVYIN